MGRTRFRILTIASMLFGGLTFGAFADIDVGSDGSDGVFNPTADVEIDLGLAAEGKWDIPSPVAGQGVYDPEKWAVVFKYSSVDIPAGVTVTFKNHPKNAPVIWLVQGSVNVQGSVELNGGWGDANGPGGFDAGRGSTTDPAGAGYGPGGGAYDPAGFGDGSYGTSGTGGAAGPTYGNPRVLPLIGGSGGGGGDGVAGSAGGGAILIAADTTIDVNGGIRAWSTGDTFIAAGGGSGGAIRLVGDSISVAGEMRATGADNRDWDRDGGEGRIRLEGNSVTVTGTTDPTHTEGLPGDPAQIFPEPDAPVIRIAEIAGKSAPSDPAASRDFPEQDVEISNSNLVTVSIEAENMPTGWIVELRAVPVRGQDTVVEATFESGDNTLSYWSAQLELPSGTSTLQVRGYLP